MLRMCVCYILSPNLDLERRTLISEVILSQRCEKKIAPRSLQIQEY
jgi:hypothetical protein